MAHVLPTALVPAHKYNNVKTHLFTAQAQLMYVENLKKEAEQRCVDTLVELTKAQQQRDEAQLRARRYEVQFEQNLKPQFEATQRENVKLNYMGPQIVTRCALDSLGDLRCFHEGRTEAPSACKIDVGAVHSGVSCRTQYMVTSRIALIAASWDPHTQVSQAFIC